jgi:hypothetical protein
MSVDDAYTVSKYSVSTYTRSDVDEVINTCRELHGVLERVEKLVLG